MGTIEQGQTEPETTGTTETMENSPFEEICPRHGEKIHRYHGCSKCVIEEVRRHERRIAAVFECEVPIPAESIDQANELLADISWGGTPE